jgi:uncharacterized protein DUF4255
VIHEVDEGVRALIQRNVIDGTSVEISFEAPTREWAAKRTNPTINVYLYDIREDVSRRQVQFEEVRDDQGRVIDRRQPSRRFRLTYFLTAWTQRPEDEHRLLANLLGCFLTQDYLPADVLTGSLRDAGKVVVATVAMPVGHEKQISEVWSALGGELKPSLDLAIVAPMNVGKSLPFGPPVTEQPRFVVARSDAIEVASNGHRETAPTERDEHPAAVSPASAGPWSAEETIRAGRANDPGRVVRIRQWKR